MFRSLGLLDAVACPEYSQCNLDHCIFSHSLNNATEPSHAGFQKKQTASSFLEKPVDGPRKRRRIADHARPSAEDTHILAASTGIRHSAPSPRSTRSISPPPRRRDNLDERASAKGGTAAQSRMIQTNQKVDLLSPRMLPNAPAPHVKRMQIIKMMFEQLDRLNQALMGSLDPSDHTLGLSRDDLILQALDEEETAATKNPSIYENVVKMRIMRLKKSSVFDWKAERLKHLAGRNQPAVTGKQEKGIKTGLSQPQEIAFLPRLIAEQSGLDQHGYVTAIPPPSDVERTRQGLEAARGWEECDRCKSRFQVFAGRRSEDGALTSGGSCTYHPARVRRPLAVDKADKSKKEPIYACCNETLGISSGCTVATTHVFKVTSPARLELLTSFERTPENENTNSKLGAVCFDCEMGYTTHGLEMIRLTATSFPAGVTVIDVLVRPQGVILDFNSRYSGVWPEDFAKALPHESSSLPHRNGERGALPIVESLAVARELLFTTLSPSIPLIGHALDNDLNVARIIHPAIIDTVLLFPHPRGLPIRYGLKMLTKKYLDRDIQTGDGSHGHDSKEDAIAAGDLVRFKIQEAWSRMSCEGWTVEGTEFIPPTS